MEHFNEIKKLNIIKKFENNTLTIEDLREVEECAYKSGYKQGSEDKQFDIYGF